MAEVGHPYLTLTQTIAPSSPWQYHFSALPLPGRSQLEWVGGSKIFGPFISWEIKQTHVFLLWLFSLLRYLWSSWDLRTCLFSMDKNRVSYGSFVWKSTAPVKNLFPALTTSLHHLKKQVHCKKIHSHTLKNHTSFYQCSKVFSDSQRVSTS